MSNLIDSGWAAWLPFELIDALEARSGRSADRRALRKRLERWAQRVRRGALGAVPPGLPVPHRPARETPGG